MNWCVARSGTGLPDPGQQLASSPGPVGGHGPILMLRRKVPRVEGALAVKPSTRAVPPARSTGASSMQGPMARAEATRVITLSPTFARSWRAAEVEVLPDELGQAMEQGAAGGKDQPGIGHQAVVDKEDADTVGFVQWQHLLGAPFLGPVFCFETIIPDSQGHPLASSRAVSKTVLRWILPITLPSNGKWWHLPPLECWRSV